VGNADRYLNNLRPCLNTEGYGGEEPPSIKNGPNLFYGWEGSGGGREVHGEVKIAGEPQDADGGEPFADADGVVATLDGGTAEHRTRGKDSGATYGGKALRRSAGNGGFLGGGTVEHRTGVKNGPSTG